VVCVERMSLTHLTVRVRNPRDPRRYSDVEDARRFTSHLRRAAGAAARRLGIRPDGKERFTLADGSHVVRETGTAIFEIDGRRRGSPVIFGRRGDASLMGALTLEALGLMLDPLKRRLRPLPLLPV